jgi:hypothetical protein
MMGIIIVPIDDWRRHGQEKYLFKRVFSHCDYHQYRPGWDHDHCEFCGAKFSVASEDLHHGYVTDDDYYWICEECFQGD